MRNTEEAFNKNRVSQLADSNFIQTLIASDNETTLVMNNNESI